MDHLGERLSALVDGELGHAERDRVLRHLAACETCRFEAEMLRGLKRRLHGLDSPEPSTDFLGRLSSLSGPPAEPPAQDPPGGAGGFGSMPPLGSSRPIGGGLPRVFGGDSALAVAEPAAAPAPERPRRPRAARAARPLSVLRPRWERTRFAVAGVSVLAVALGTAFVAGGDSEDAPVVTPPIDDYAIEHAVTSRQVPVPDSQAPDAPGGPAKVSPVGETSVPASAPR
ncbi:zf-HC2 domain-containing protein [Streptomonospora sp. PA3]|uniref:anti-sigma factor family protein n=1 Tax=Streptomonospora sp. PA3 TaxID=2607326 RepID=UPI0012DBDD6F|nr:zf-HC2 domain-containing protein [Streptomonospora sp. PA3]MUL39830.1 zf-HC2 domain-containing protein [Streptomonospora sp. PA3]